MIWHDNWFLLFIGAFLLVLILSFAGRFVIDYSQEKILNIIFIIFCVAVLFRLTQNILLLESGIEFCVGELGDKIQSFMGFTSFIIRYIFEGKTYEHKVSLRRNQISGNKLVLMVGKKDPQKIRVITDMPGYKRMIGEQVPPNVN
jgi:hypothetical protein